MATYVCASLNINSLIEYNPGAAASLYKISNGQFDDIPEEHIAILKNMWLIEGSRDYRLCYGIKEAIERFYVFDDKSQTLRRNRKT